MVQIDKKKIDKRVLQLVGPKMKIFAIAKSLKVEKYIHSFANDFFFLLIYMIYLWHYERDLTIFELVCSMYLYECVWSSEIIHSGRSSRDVPCDYVKNGSRRFQCEFKRRKQKNKNTYRTERNTMNGQPRALIVAETWRQEWIYET